MKNTHFKGILILLSAAAVCAFVYLQSTSSPIQKLLLTDTEHYFWELKPDEYTNIRLHPENRNNRRKLPAQNDVHSSGLEEAPAVSPPWHAAKPSYQKQSWTGSGYSGIAGFGSAGRAKSVLPSSKYGSGAVIMYAQRKASRNSTSAYPHGGFSALTNSGLSGIHRSGTGLPDPGEGGPAIINNGLADPKDGDPVILDGALSSGNYILILLSLACILIKLIGSACRLSASITRMPLSCKKES